MPLIKGPKAKTKTGIGENIKKLEDEGRPRKQSVAIALGEAREAGAKIPPPKHKSKKGKK